MEKEHNKEMQDEHDNEQNETKIPVQQAMYVEFADEFLDLNPDHCLNKESVRRRG